MRYPLNLPEFEFAYRVVGETRLIFDPLRRRYVELTPEEWVRQNFVQFLIQDRSYPRSLITIEKGFMYQGMARRADIVAHGREGNALLVAECKAPSVPVSQAAFDQIGRYNSVLQASFLVVTNGTDHYCCAVDAAAGTVQFARDIPDYKDIS